jgi:SAM-dependent methyltransferase
MIKKMMGALRGTKLSRMLEEVSGVKQQMVELRSDFARMQRQMVELRSGFENMQQQITEHQGVCAGMQQEITQRRSELAVIRRCLLTLRYHGCCRLKEPTPSAAKQKRVAPMSEQFDHLRQLAPQAFALWRQLLEVNGETYMGFPIHSCSVGGHPMATLFRFFLAPYLRGRVLDIGCGPQPVPVYLEDHPVEALYGIDPLGEADEHPFHFAKGLAELLPWVDRQFNTVVAATTLDHVLLLDKVFEEVVRVLSDDGIFVVWVSFFPGAKPYDPYQKSVEKVDDYHLFHFDREWFMKVIEPFFTLFEEFTFDPPETSSFLALRPRRQGITYSSGSDECH